jgi:hypothetical protein
VANAAGGASAAAGAPAAGIGVGGGGGGDDADERSAAGRLATSSARERCARGPGRESTIISSGKERFFKRVQVFVLLLGLNEPCALHLQRCALEAISMIIHGKVKMIGKELPARQR